MGKNSPLQCGSWEVFFFLFLRERPFQTFKSGLLRRRGKKSASSYYRWYNKTYIYGWAF